MTLPAVHPFLLGALRGSEWECLLPLASGDGDWEAIIRDAAAQGLTPFLYRCLKRAAAAGQVPESLAARLEGPSFGLAARNMMLASELGRILRAFTERQVPCAPLRGLALAERLYGGIAARPIGDIDLLVRKENLPRVAAALRDLGFREMSHRAGFPQDFSYTLTFLKQQHGWTIVEPHWTTAYPPFIDRVDMNGVWERCARGQVAGVETWLLGREDLLLHLCLHLTHPDSGAPLLWFYELDRLVRQEQTAFDWSRFLTLARHGQFEFLLGQSLCGVRALFQTPIPDHVLNQLTSEPPRSLEGRLICLLASASGLDGKEELAVLLTRKGFCAKLRYALGLLFPSPHFMRLRYVAAGRTPLGFVYCWRCCRLSWAAARGFVQFLLQPLGDRHAEGRAMNGATRPIPVCEGPGVKRAAHFGETVASVPHQFAGPKIRGHQSGHHSSSCGTP